MIKEKEAINIKDCLVALMALWLIYTARERVRDRDRKLDQHNRETMGPGFFSVC